MLMRGTAHYIRNARARDEGVMLPRSMRLQVLNHFQPRQEDVPFPILNRKPPNEQDLHYQFHITTWS